MMEIVKKRFLELITNIKKILVVPEYAFLAFALFFGILFVFITPPLQTPDENSHFLRAYQVSDFNFIGQPFEKDGNKHFGAEIPVSVNKAIPGLMGDVAGQAKNEFDTDKLKEYIRQPLERDNKEYTIIEAAGIYSPIIYVPQATGINIGKAFNASPLTLIWMGRIVNLLVWITAIFFAIKFFALEKWVLVVLALNPVALFMAASLSPDVINIGFGFLFVSLVINTFKTKTVLTKKYLALLLVVLAVLSLSKPVNLLFALLLFAIPVQRFKNKTKYMLYCIGGILVAGGLFVAWNAQIKDILDAAVYSQSGGRNVNVSDQLHYILGAPFEYLRTLISNFILVYPGTYGDAVLTTYFGVFGWLDTALPLWVMMVYLLLLFTTLLYQIGRGANPRFYQKVIFISVLLLASVGTITAMYFNATAVGSPVISGVQGRYFIPFIIMAVIVFTAKKKILYLSNSAIAVVCVSVLSGIFLMTTYELASRYY